METKEINTFCMHYNTQIQDGVGVFNTSTVRLPSGGFLHTCRTMVPINNSDKIVPGNPTLCRGKISDSAISSTFLWGWRESDGHVSERSNIYISRNGKVDYVRNPYGLYLTDARLMKLENKIYLYSRNMSYIAEIEIVSNMLEIKRLFLNPKYDDANINMQVYDVGEYHVSYLHWIVKNGLTVCKSSASYTGEDIILSKYNNLFFYLKMALRGRKPLNEETLRGVVYACRYMEDKHGNVISAGLGNDFDVDIQRLEQFLNYICMTNKIKNIDTKEECKNLANFIYDAMDYIDNSPTDDDEALREFNDEYEKKFDESRGKMMDWSELKYAPDFLTYAMDLKAPVIILDNNSGPEVVVARSPNAIDKQNIIVGPGTKFMPAFSFSTPPIKISKSNKNYLISIGHSKINSGEFYPFNDEIHKNDYNEESDVYKFRKKLYDYMKNEFVDKYKPHFGTNVSKESCSGYIYMFYFIVTEQDNDGNFIEVKVSDSYLPVGFSQENLAEEYSYKFSLIFPMGIWTSKTNSDAIFVSGGEGDYYSVVMGFSVNNIIDVSHHNIKNEVENYKYKIIKYKSKLSKKQNCDIGDGDWKVITLD